MSTWISLLLVFILFFEAHACKVMESLKRRDLFEGEFCIKKDQYHNNLMMHASFRMCVKNAIESKPETSDSDLIDEYMRHQYGPHELMLWMGGTNWRQVLMDYDYRSRCYTADVVLYTQGVFRFEIFMNHQKFNAIIDINPKTRKSKPMNLKLWEWGLEVDRFLPVMIGDLSQTPQTLFYTTKTLQTNGFVFECGNSCGLSQSSVSRILHPENDPAFVPFSNDHKLTLWENGQNVFDMRYDAQLARHPRELSLVFIGGQDWIQQAFCWLIFRFHLFFDEARVTKSNHMKKNDVHIINIATHLGGNSSTNNLQIRVYLFKTIDQMAEYIERFGEPINSLEPVLIGASGVSGIEDLAMKSLFELQLLLFDSLHHARFFKKPVYFPELPQSSLASGDKRVTSYSMSLEREILTRQVLKAFDITEMATSSALMDVAIYDDSLSPKTEISLQHIEIFKSEYSKIQLHIAIHNLLRSLL